LAAAGSTVVLAPGVVGAAPMSWQWWFNGTNLAGATNQFLVLTNVAAGNAGSYQCVAGNGLGTVTNQPTGLVVSSIPRFGPLSFSPATGITLELDQLTGHGPLILYASPDLVNWAPIATNPPATGSVQFVDGTATNAPARFYRAVQE